MEDYQDPTDVLGTMLLKIQDGYFALQEKFSEVRKEYAELRIAYGVLTEKYVHFQAILAQKAEELTQIRGGSS